MIINFATKHLTMHILPPQPSDYGFFNNYMSKAPQTDLVTTLKENWKEIKSLGESIGEEGSSYRYAEGKWTIKETFVHLVDSERQFCYRIMRISRGDQGILPPLDPHGFVINSNASARSMASILNELELLRKATIMMFENMAPELLDVTGPARDAIVTPRALGYIMTGHTIHHMQILRERYLQPA